MSISPSTYQFLDQLGPMSFIDATAGPAGPTGVQVYLLIGANGWHNGRRLPHEVVADLDAQGHAKRLVEGIEYYLVPKTSTGGRLAHYAQTTGVADLQNPPGGGVNPAREAYVGGGAENSHDPDGVAKFVEDAPTAWDEAKQLRDEQEALVRRQVDESPHRSHADGSLADVTVSEEKPAKAAPKKAE